MPPNFQHLMREATRLTRSGNLRAAAAAIQAALAGTGAVHAAPAPQGDVIDVPAREVHATAPAHATAPELAERSRAEPPLAQAPPPSTPPAAAPAVAPTPSRFIAGASGTGPSRRDYKLFIPPGAGARALPLVVMLHGCTQDPDDFAAGTAMNESALRQGFYVLYPGQSRDANPQRCWNWFKHSHQARDRGEPALLAAMTREVMAQHAIDERRVYVAGLSAGGAMAAILGATYPDLYAAVGVHSGLAAGAAQDLPSALGAMKNGAPAPRAAASGIPTIVFHGDADATVHPANGEQVVVATAGPGAAAQATQGRASGGRGYTHKVLRDAQGQVVAEHWVVHGAAHAWSGGSGKGSYTDARGPDASAEMVRFFLAHPRR